jgi:type I restriction enzyme, R subunit
VRQVIDDAVDAGDVIDLFAAAGLDAARLDILSEDFLNRVSALEQKNLALQALQKLLTDQIKISERTNLVQAHKFRKALEKAMLGYPPDVSEDATQLVLRQAELSTESGA